MPPKAKLQAPIDRPLSRAYVREFTGWSTAEPPGLCDPTSFRVMENVQINRDGSARIRPGLRYLSYEVAPFSNYEPPPAVIGNPIVVGGSEASLSNGGGSYAELALPGTAIVGDMIILALQGDVVDSPDERLELVWAGAFWGGQAKFYVGYADDLSPLLINVTGAWAQASMVFFRDGDGLPLRYVLSQTDIAGPSSSTTALLPGLDGADLSGAICAFMGADGIGGSYGDQDWSKAPAYGSPDVIHDGHAYRVTEYAITTTLPVPEQTTPHKETGSSEWVAMVLGVRIGDEPEDPGAGGYSGGIAYDRPFVGTHEAFYLNDGSKAYLQAVREEDGTVGFRALVFDVHGTATLGLDDPKIDFTITQPLEVLNFSADTTYVKYLQIDNKIFALSDNGENMRVFNVGARKDAKALTAITRPEWENEDKLSVVHPDADWINSGEPTGSRRNRLPNPSFETNLVGWHGGPTTKLTRPKDPPFAAVAGERMVRLASAPERTNLAMQPLHNVAVLGVTGWTGAPPAGSSKIVGQEDVGGVDVEADGSWMKATFPAPKNHYFVRSRLLPGVEPGEKYKVAFDVDAGAHLNAECRVKFYGVNAGVVGETAVLAIDGGIVTGGVTRWVSRAVTAPKGAVTMKVLIGGETTQAGSTFIKVKNVMVCPAGESTDIFTGTAVTTDYYFWTGDANDSASVYHPPAYVALVSDKVTVRPGKALCGSMYVTAETTARNATLDMRMYDRDSQELTTQTSGPVADVVGTPTRISAGSAAIHSRATQADLRLHFPPIPFGEYHWVDAAMLEAMVSVPGTYFDGSTTDVPTDQHSWTGEQHGSASVHETFAIASTIPDPETRTADTLVGLGGPSVNTYSFGFFYTFENEVGESAASKITVRRAQRAWSDWVWETPNAAGEPSGTNTDNPNKVADQLVAIMPEEVFDEALAMGAIEWNLYMFTWSDQDAAPVIASKVGTKEIPVDAVYGRHGWIRVTPVMADSVDDLPLPTKANRYNYSDPSRGGQGLVAADRMVLVNDPTAAGVIRWSSNRMGEYTNFTAGQGGGYKTLTSGNLFVPAAVKLWQNPQSADTLCILCLGTDGHSTSYYMAPAQVASQSEAVNVMGFEETTATPGTTSPYGVEVFNNSLYHPLDDQLMKSTASNYNINHKSQTDLIRNMWEKLADKYWIMSSVHDSRLYYIVHNPEGYSLEDGCKGNEIWVFDAAAKTGTWSRFLIQAHSLRKIEFGGQVYMSVVRPDGVFYLDPEHGLDDVVGEDFLVSSRTIPWRFETNTQGANRAHDAWAHLQQLSISLGYFQGRMRYGIRSVDINGRAVDMPKIVKDVNPPDALAFDIEDQLSIRRDLKEWFFYAGSITDDEGEVEYSYGQVNLVQFRYTPVSVNVGYEHGSIETFEYGRDVAQVSTSTTDNGIPLPHLDSRRP